MRPLCTSGLCSRFSQTLSAWTNETDFITIVFAHQGFIAPTSKSARCPPAPLSGDKEGVCTSGQRCQPFGPQTCASCSKRWRSWLRTSRPAEASADTGCLYLLTNSFQTEKEVFSTKTTENKEKVTNAPLDPLVSLSSTWNIGASKQTFPVSSEPNLERRQDLSLGKFLRLLVTAASLVTTDGVLQRRGGRCPGGVPAAGAPGHLPAV